MKYLIPLYKRSLKTSIGKTRSWCLPYKLPQLSPDLVYFPPHWYHLAWQIRNHSQHRCPPETQGKWKGSLLQEALLATSWQWALYSNISCDGPLTSTWGGLSSSDYSYCDHSFNDTERGAELLTPWHLVFALCLAVSLAPTMASGTEKTHKKFLTE